MEAGLLVVESRSAVVQLLRCVGFVVSCLDLDIYLLHFLQDNLCGTAAPLGSPVQSTLHTSASNGRSEPSGSLCSLFQSVHWCRERFPGLPGRTARSQVRLLSLLLLVSQCGKILYDLHFFFYRSNRH